MHTKVHTDVAILFKGIVGTRTNVKSMEKYNQAMMANTCSVIMQSQNNIYHE